MELDCDLQYALPVPTNSKTVKSSVNKKSDNSDTAEPRWLAVVASLSIGLIYAALPGNLSMGPRWLLLAVIVPVLISTLISHRAGHHTADRILGYLSSGILTAAMVWSMALLISAILNHKINPTILLRSAIALWVTNILVFALWYWRLDAGGPHKREKLVGHRDGAFLFPQMARGGGSVSDWSPNFVDYLFLAFNTSTALSPTDTAVLSRWAKILMMMQAAISLTVIALLAARAVNIL